MQVFSIVSAEAAEAAEPSIARIIPDLNIVPMAALSLTRRTEKLVAESIEASGARESSAFDVSATPPARSTAVATGDFDALNFGQSFRRRGRSHNNAR